MKATLMIAVEPMMIEKVSDALDGMDMHASITMGTPYPLIAIAEVRDEAALSEKIEKIGKIKGVTHILPMAHIG